MINLNAQEKEYIAMIAAAAAKEVCKDGINVHIETCPIGMEFRLTKARLCGLVIGMTAASAGVGSGVGVMLAKLFGV
jgi:hypothetical protein